jgi:hypothetical protein
LFTLSGMRGFVSSAVVLPLQPDEMLREPLDSGTNFGGELVSCGIIDRSRRSRDLVSAAQEEPGFAEECLCLLGCLRRRRGRTRVGERVPCHVDSFHLAVRLSLLWHPGQAQRVEITRISQGPRTWIMRARLHDIRWRCGT